MLNISIVIYNHSFEEIEPLVSEFAGFPDTNELFLVDNSTEKNDEFLRLPVTYIFNNKNLGYGKAHNIALRKTIEQKTPYHLVINPDVEVRSEVLLELHNYMELHPDVGHIMPKVLYPDGEIQYLCKLLPKPSDLIFRRFLPKSWCKKSKAQFELRHSGYDKIMEVPYLSGSFMLLRTEALEKVGLFDERFFMYPEDIDLTRRIHRHYKTIFYPHVSIIHHHEQASYKNRKMLLIHLFNLAKYFNKWGWFFDAERKRINKETLKKINLL